MIGPSRRAVLPLMVPAGDLPSGRPVDPRFTGTSIISVRPSADCSTASVVRWPAVATTLTAASDPLPDSSPSVPSRRRRGRDGPLRSPPSDPVSGWPSRAVVHPSHSVVLGAISLDLFAVLFGGAVALIPIVAAERLGVGDIATDGCEPRRGRRGLYGLSSLPSRR